MPQPTTSITRNEIVETILRDYGPVEKIVLFGSAARGDADEYSDIDLIIVKETTQRFVRRSVEAPYFSVPSDIFVYTPQEFEQMKENENPFLLSALEEGIVLYERGKQ
jgi:predicted nucleotidyltransferase